MLLSTIVQLLDMLLKNSNFYLYFYKYSELLVSKIKVDWTNFLSVQ